MEILYKNNIISIKGGYYNFMFLFNNQNKKLKFAEKILEEKTYDELVESYDDIDKSQKSIIIEFTIYCIVMSLISAMFFKGNLQTIETTIVAEVIIFFLIIPLELMIKRYTSEAGKKIGKFNFYYKKKLLTKDFKF